MGYSMIRSKDYFGDLFAPKAPKVRKAEPR